MTKRERVVLRIDAQTHSTDGQILSYLKDDPALSSREAIMRALKAFYLPWVLEEGRSETQLRAIAKTAIEELHYRAFQIKQRFLSEVNIISADTPVSLDQNIALVMNKDVLVEPPVVTTLAEMMQDVDGLGSEQYLDDF